MKLFDGGTSLELERDGARLVIHLTAAQFDEAALGEIAPSVTAEKEDEREEGGWRLSYVLSETAESLAAATQRTKSRLDRLRLAQSLSSLSGLSGKFRIPFLHPENIFLEGNRVFAVHSGLEGEMAPMTLSEADFLTAYKALILSLFNPKNSFERFVSGEETGNDKFAQSLNRLESLPEVMDFIDAELERESLKVRQKELKVSKGRYRFFKYSGLFALLAVLVLAGFTYSFYHQNQKQAAIITAHTDFLTDNYAQTQTDLTGYALGELPKSARYLLAVSSVNLSDLTLTQKETILKGISTKTDDNTLNYWSETGRGDFDKALNLAKNLGDTQLTLLAYTNLYQTTKLNTTMDGEKKQKLMEDYSKQIQELTKEIEK
ncbi:type VII secretion protein EssB [Lactovum odontotermitis]